MRLTTYHITKDIKEFAKKEQLKFLFNVPYKSDFNGIELIFHLIKNNIYKEIQKNMKEMTKKIIFYIDDENTNKNVIKAYLQIYEKFIEFFEKKL